MIMHARREKGEKKSVFVKVLGEEMGKEVSPSAGRDRFTSNNKRHFFFYPISSDLKPHGISELISISSK